MAQYSLNLSDSLYQEIKCVAKEHDKTARELIITLLKAGMVALEAHDNPSKELLFRETFEDNRVREREIMIL